MYTREVWRTSPATIHSGLPLGQGRPRMHEGLLVPGQAVGDVLGLAPAQERQEAGQDGLVQGVGDGLVGLGLAGSKVTLSRREN